MMLFSKKSDPGVLYEHKCSTFQMCGRIGGLSRPPSGMYHHGCNNYKSDGIHLLVSNKIC